MLIENFILLVNQAHAGLYRKGNRQDEKPDPHISHLLRVMGNTIKLARAHNLVTDDIAVKKLKILALGHDLYEDTIWTEDDLGDWLISQDYLLARKVAEEINILTRAPGQSYVDYLMKIASSSPYVKLVKQADILDNIYYAHSIFKPRYEAALHYLMIGEEAALDIIRAWEESQVWKQFKDDEAIISLSDPIHARPEGPQHGILLQ